jgi:hypothetical protein
MKETLDTLAKKAEALEAMVRRGDLTIKDAARLMEAERTPWMNALTLKVANILEDKNLVKYLTDKLKR